MNEELSRISTLTSSLNCEQIEAGFKFIVELAKKAHTEEESNLIMTALFYLADMQWETYQLLTPEIRSNLDAVFQNFWIKNSVDSTEKLLSIVSRLGLSSTYTYMRASNSDNLDFDVRCALASAHAEFGEDISDPFSGMRRFPARGAQVCQSWRGSSNPWCGIRPNCRKFIWRNRDSVRVDFENFCISGPL